MGSLYGDKTRGFRRRPLRAGPLIRRRGAALFRAGLSGERAPERQLEPKAGAARARAF